MLWLNICWTTRCQLKDGHKDTSHTREGTWNSYCYRAWKQSVGKGQEEALISLYNRITSFLVFRLFFQCKHVHGCFMSHTSKWLVPSLNLFLCSPLHHPTKQFSNRVIHWIPVSQPNIGYKLILKLMRNDNSESCPFGLKNNGHHFLNDIWGVRILRVSWQECQPFLLLPALLCDVCQVAEPLSCFAYI